MYALCITPSHAACYHRCQFWVVGQFPVSVNRALKVIIVRCTIPVMFCPECRAEYRPGFTRCSDCDVDLVHEIPEQGTRVRNRKRDSATMFPTFRNTYREGGSTVQWWTSYRHQTGGWPWFSIVIHLMNWVVILIGGGFLI